MQSSEEILDELFAGLGRGGKKPRKLQMEFSRNLTREDLLALSTHQGTKPKSVKQMRQSHHFCAKLVAEGRKGPEISAITGYAPSTISNLKHDPAFQELVEHYKAQTEEIYVDVHQRLAALSLDAVEVLHEQLLEKPETIKVEEKIKIAQLGLDRTGFGPTSTTRLAGGVAVLTEETLARIKDEANQRGRGAVRTLSADSGPVDSIPGTGQSLAEAEEAEGNEGERTDLREEVHQVVEDEPTHLRRSAA